VQLELYLPLATVIKEKAKTNKQTPSQKKQTNKQKQSNRQETKKIDIPK